MKNLKVKCSPLIINIFCFLLFIWIYGLLIISFPIDSFVSAQSATQTIRGRVIDSESKFPLPGAHVALITDTAHFSGAATDEEGAFRIENVPLGRQTIKVSFLGYKQAVIANIIVTAGKEVVLNIELEEAVVTVGTVEIIAIKRNEVMNEMSTVSAKAFTVEETERYAGSRGDPARMASNFAGVTGADDSRNDIVVRGNSPLSILWRLEGIPIPNPNHFAISGSQGGPVSILNNKVLASSDFFTGAFPAEFGNSTAAVFDLRMRSGNNEKHEFNGQLGFLGTELSAEGPVSREKKSSYLLNYRYSTLDLFSFAGIKIGTSAIPRYQDAAFKLNFPGKNSAFSLFGIGGMSKITILVHEQKPDEMEIYGENDRDQYFNSGMGVAGLNYTRSFSSNTFGKFTAAYSTEQQHAYHELIYYTRDSTGKNIIDEKDVYKFDSLVPILDYTYTIGKASASLSVNHKLSPKHILKGGVNIDEYFFNLIDSVYNHAPAYDWKTRWDYNGTALLLQPYVQLKYKISDQLTFNAGLHSQYFSNGSLSPVEPRLGVRWSMSKKQIFGAGAGLHSQLQPLYTYYYRIPDGQGGYALHNRKMDFTKSWHSVVSYDYLFFDNLRMKAEGYYQYLYNVPVTIKPSTFSLINQGSGFARFFPDSLENTGTGLNYGIDFTLEKFFSKKYFFMATASLYDSRYRGSDGILRDTDFKGDYAFNFLGSREFRLGKKSAFAMGAKITYAGNKRYGPVDTLASQINQEIIYIDSLRNTMQMPDYFRIDLKINIRLNALKVTHEIGLDLVNILNRKNVLKLTYAPNPPPGENPLTYDHIEEVPQLGFLPIFYYKVDF
ncbi:MAG: TonB-dependent receptor [Bacteroidetes bacterium]|nr:TonB-dependent receptor [Bacteroidota bacterium]